MSIPRCSAEHLGSRPFPVAGAFVPEDAYQKLSIHPVTATRSPMLLVTSVIQDDGQYVCKHGAVTIFHLIEASLPKLYC